MENKFELDSKTVYSIAIFISIGLIIGALFIIYYEISDAKKSCEDLEMEYKFVIPYKHLCNNKSFFKYSDAWDFSRVINYSSITFP